MFMMGLGRAVTLVIVLSLLVLAGCVGLEPFKCVDPAEMAAVRTIAILGGGRYVTGDVKSATGCGLLSTCLGIGKPGAKEGAFENLIAAREQLFGNLISELNSSGRFQALSMQEVQSRLGTQEIVLEAPYEYEVQEMEGGTQLLQRTTISVNWLVELDAEHLAALREGFGSDVDAVMVVWIPAYQNKRALDVAGELFSLRTGKQFGHTALMKQSKGTGCGPVFIPIGSSDNAKKAAQAVAKAMVEVAGTGGKG